jgi:hypothetical protein
MKRLIALLTLLPLLGMGGGQYTIPWHTGATAAAAGGGITPVGTPVCVSTGLPYNLSYTPNAAGDTIVVGVNGLYGNLGTATVTDSTSATYPAQTTYVYAGTQIFGTLSVSAGVTYISVASTGGTGNGTICVSEYAGPKHFGNTINNGSWSGTSYSISLTMQDANNYIVMFGNSITCCTAPVPTATAGTVRANSTNQNGGAWVQDNTSASTGTLAASGTLNLSSGGFLTAIELRSH